MAAEIRVRAERRAGELLEKMEKARGKRTDLIASHDHIDDRLTLSDLGITKDQSSRWQKLAQVPEKNFERCIEEARCDQSPACCPSIRESKAALLDANISAVNIPRGMLCRTGKRICVAT